MLKHDSSVDRQYEFGSSTQKVLNLDQYIRNPCSSQNLLNEMHFSLLFTK